MEWLNEDAFDTFLSLTWLAWQSGNLAPHVFAARLRFLDEAVEPGTRQAADLNAHYDWLPGGFGRRVPEDGDALPIREVDTVAAEGWEIRGGATSGPTSHSDPPLLRLVVGPAWGDKGWVRTWEFHAGDRDPRPSVPHGHLQKDGRDEDKTKLDPWRNRVRTRGKAARPGREDPRAVIALWNDPRFQTLARNALALHLDNPELRPAFLGLLNERGIKLERARLLPHELRALRRAAPARVAGGRRRRGSAS